MNLWERIFGKSISELTLNALQAERAEHLEDMRRESEWKSALLDKIVASKFDMPVIHTLGQQEQTPLVPMFNAGVIGGDTEDFLQEMEKVANA